MAKTPMEQRNSGRRAHRRQQQQEQHGPRGPSEVMERRIQQAIEACQCHPGSAGQAETVEPAVLNGGKYEYLDHTADVQLHSWGDSLEEALENLVIALFCSMTQLSLVEAREEANGTAIEAQGYDMT